MDETTTLRTVESIARMEARIAELTAERDAALAAVDAVRADYAPRREPPTEDEIVAIDMLNPGVGGSILRWRGGIGLAMGVNPGACVSLSEGSVWIALGPTGPMPWSKLAPIAEKVRRG